MRSRWNAPIAYAAVVLAVVTFVGLTNRFFGGDASGAGTTPTPTLPIPTTGTSPEPTKAPTPTPPPPGGGTKQVPLAGDQGNTRPVLSSVRDWPDLLKAGANKPSYQQCLASRIGVSWKQVRQFAHLVQGKHWDLRFILVSNSSVSDEQARQKLMDQGFEDVGSLPIRRLAGFENTEGLPENGCKPFIDGRSQVRISLGIPLSLTDRSKGMVQDRGVLAMCSNPWRVHHHHPKPHHPTPSPSPSPRCTTCTPTPSPSPSTHSPSPSPSESPKDPEKDCNKPTNPCGHDPGGGGGSGGDGPKPTYSPCDDGSKPPCPTPKPSGPLPSASPTPTETVPGGPTPTPTFP